MHHFALVLAASGLGLLTLGCASTFPWAGASPPGESGEVISAEIESVLQVLPQVHVRLGLDPSIERDGEAAVVVANRRVQIHRSDVGPRDAPYARCAIPASSGESGDVVDLALRRVEGFATMELRTELTRVEGGTRIQSELTVSSAAESSPASDGGALCVTTGRLESLLLESIRGLAAPPDSIPSPSDEALGPFE